MIAPRRFPIMWRNEQKKETTHYIPWDFADEVIRPYAQINHGQTLERLAERGGLSYEEAALAMMGRGLFGPVQPTQQIAQYLIHGGMHAFDRLKGKPGVK